MISALSKFCNSHEIAKCNAPDPRSTTLIDYLSFRIIGINAIKEISSLFRVKKETMHKAIYFMDKVYLTSDCAEEKDIEDIGRIFIIISMKFNEKSSSYPQGKVIQASGVIDYQIKEVHCLKLLCYSLTDLSAFDWLSSLIANEFHLNEKKALRKVYHKALCLLDELVEDIRFLDFKPKETAIGIIKITSHLMGIQLCLPNEAQLQYSTNCLLVYITIITQSNLIVFVPKPSPFIPESKHSGVKCALDYDSGSTSDSNDLSLKSFQL